MADENKEVKAEDKKKEETNPQILEMQQTMTEMGKRLEQATEVLKGKDKEIDEMRAAGVKVVSDKLAKEKDLKDAFGIKNADAPKKSSDDINSLTNVQMLEVVADAVEGMVEATREEAALVIDDNFKGLESKFDNITAHIMKAEAATALQQVRNDNKDFDKYQTDIKVILEKHVDFSYQDAYDWVKMKEAKGAIASKHIESEKPDKDLSSADESVERVYKQPEGRKMSRKRTFDMLISDAIDKVQARRGGS